MVDFQVSPGVRVSEVDLTTRTPVIANNGAGLVGLFAWGPLNEVVLVSSENDLVENFNLPNSNTYISFLSAANFLAYGNKLRVVRVTNESTAKNATADGGGLLIRNDEHYENSYSSGQGSVGNWAAKFAGSLGNSLKVSICSGSAAFESRELTGTISTSGTTVSGTNTEFQSELSVGDYLIDESGNKRLIESIASDTSATLKSAFPANLSGESCTAEWEFSHIFRSAPGTSAFASERGMSADEMHVVVSDEGGLWTGVAGTVLEKYEFLSAAGNAKNDDGTTNYYAEVINQKSKFIRWMDHPTEGTNWGVTANGTAFGSHTIPEVNKLSGGVSAESTATDSDYTRGWDLFIPKTVEVRVLIGGSATTAVATHIISNVCEVRKDCVVCLSPEQADVVNNSGSEVSDTISFRNTLPSSSYAVMTNNWKYQLDRWNGVNRWVPDCSDIAGLIVRTSQERQPWFSPAGHARGQIKNVIKLAYNATEAQRDALYNAGINAVIQKPGQGTLLFGDRTLLSRPSAFDRINVRMLFIVLEETISRAAESLLFELNDAFTRAQFRHIVEPFLRDVQGQRGIEAFKVVCDSTNNTPAVVSRNEFVGDIYIKPVHSINFIRLNFVAVGSGVEFNTVVGQF